MVISVTSSATARNSLRAAASRAFAARWLRIPLDRLYGQIAFGKIEAVKIESREFVEWEALKVYESKRNRPQNAWDRIDEWRK